MSTCSNFEYTQESKGQRVFIYNLGRRLVNKPVHDLIVVYLLCYLFTISARHNLMIVIHIRQDCRTTVAHIVLTKLFFFYEIHTLYKSVCVSIDKDYDKMYPTEKQGQTGQKGKV